MKPAKHASKPAMKTINAMIAELRRLQQFARIDLDGKAELSGIERRLIKFHEERSK